MIRLPKSDHRSNASGVEMEEMRNRQQHHLNPNQNRTQIPVMGQPQPSSPSSQPFVQTMQMCLPGLECLIGTDQLFIHQEANMRELFSNVPNDFEVLTSTGQQIFKITEATGQTARTLGGGHQNFEMVFSDAGKNDIIKIQGQPGFYGGHACVAVFYIGDGNEQKIGEVVQDRVGCQLEYSVRDAFGNVMLRVMGPKFGDFCCGIFMIGSVAFPVVSLDKKTIVGGIGKLWGGFVREIFTMADNYGIQFPSDLDITTKCLLLSTALMLDFQFFERQ